MSAKKSKKTILEPARSFDLAGMVQYGEGAVVSRTLIEEAAGTITLFAFDGGQGLSEHTAPFNALVQVVEGEGKFIIGGEPCSVGQGQIVLIPAGVPHSVHADTRFKMLLTMLRSD